jgi:hypothetical protein
MYNTGFTVSGYFMSTRYVRLREFENNVLRIIFGPKREAVTGSWRKLLSETLNNFCSSSNIIRMIRTRRVR